MLGQELESSRMARAAITCSADAPRRRSRKKMALEMEIEMGVSSRIAT